MQNTSFSFNITDSWKSQRIEEDSMNLSVPLNSADWINLMIEKQGPLIAFLKSSNPVLIVGANDREITFTPLQKTKADNFQFAGWPLKTSITEEHCAFEELTPKITRLASCHLVKINPSKEFASLFSGISQKFQKNIERVLNSPKECVPESDNPS